MRLSYNPSTKGRSLCQGELSDRSRRLHDCRKRIVFRTVYSASVDDVVLLEETLCDAGDDGYVALHEPYGSVEHRLFAQAVYRSSLRRTC